ncbi:hypothetical protein K443DRAFT_37363, partial [Laccaria amethystina LaAM-08-1]
ENKTALEKFNMVINMAIRPIDWLVWGVHRLKLGTNCNFDGALPRDKQDNQTILVAAMHF